MDRAKYFSIRGKVENGRIDGPWETDNDTDENIEMQSDEFNGFKKGFLLGRETNRIYTYARRDRIAYETRGKR
jgi:hypothetical protein